MQLIDQYLRKINYLRVSVTDRCDLRCVYCMKEKMQFLPRKDILTLEEIDRLCDNFIDLGVEKIRLTGGEPLIRKDIIKLIEKLNYKKYKTNLKEITLTTNGTQLKRYSNALYNAGVRRVNVSLDSLDFEPSANRRHRVQTSGRCLGLCRNGLNILGEAEPCLRLKRQLVPA